MAKETSLQKAYEELILQAESWRKLRQPKQTVMNRRVMVRKGIYPREHLMRQQLKRAGWKLVMEERWKRK